MTLWLAVEPLILASKSTSRRALLQGAGIPAQVEPADIDERGTEVQAAVEGPAQAAALLARCKAEAVASRHRGRVVLGADQTLALGERRFSKPKDIAAARDQLMTLRGRTHTLHSGLALVRDGAVLFTHVEPAHLTMRAFSDSFLDAYLDTAGAKVCDSVGGYQLEGLGVQLFERIEGDHSTILGLPLLPLLGSLRRLGLLAA